MTAPRCAIHVSRSRCAADRLTGKGGRKPAVQSCAAEIRARLLTWKQTPEPQRISLRALARELGTSHQLVGHYLACWEKWQAKEYRLKANDIRTRAKAENRYMTPGEESQVIAYERASFRSMLDSVLADKLRQLQVAAKAGTLSKGQIKMLSLFARRGYPIAEKILEEQREHINGAPIKKAKIWS